MPIEVASVDSARLASALCADVLPPRALPIARRLEYLQVMAIVGEITPSFEVLRRRRKLRDSQGYKEQRLALIIAQCLRELRQQEECDSAFFVVDIDRLYIHRRDHEPLILRTGLLEMDSHGMPSLRWESSYHARTENCPVCGVSSTSTCHESTDLCPDCFSSAANALSLLRPEAPDYSSSSFWERRYQSSSSSYADSNSEWYLETGDTTLGASLCIAIQALRGESALTVLVPGCGDSALANEIAKAHKLVRRVVATDISPTVIAQMAARSGNGGGVAVEFCEDDITASTIADGQFNLIADKGTLDALICGREGGKRAAAAAGEYLRLLLPGGFLLLVSGMIGDHEKDALFPAQRWKRVQVSQVQVSRAHRCSVTLFYKKSSIY